MGDVRSLEQGLLQRFPAKDAEPWDRTGLTVGDPAVSVTRVAVALDPTVQNVRAAAELGANVLVTHHPAYLSAPDSFQPANSVAQCPGANVYEAAARGVAIMSFHTALDFSREAFTMLPHALGLEPARLLDPLPHDCMKGYGQVCNVDGDQTVDQIALRCADAWGRTPRVWGDGCQVVRMLVTATGSAGSLKTLCVQEHVDCLVCGEMKYHDALDLSQAGCAIIELGHDVSELPFTRILAEAVSSLGFEAVILDEPAHWHTNA